MLRFCLFSYSLYWEGSMSLYTLFNLYLHIIGGKVSPRGMDFTEKGEPRRFHTSSVTVYQDILLFSSLWLSPLYNCLVEIKFMVPRIAYFKRTCIFLFITHKSKYTPSILSPRVPPSLLSPVVSDPYHNPSPTTSLQPITHVLCQSIFLM